MGCVVAVSTTDSGGGVGAVGAGEALPMVGMRRLLACSKRLSDVFGLRISPIMYHKCSFLFHSLTGGATSSRLFM